MDKSSGEYPVSFAILAALLEGTGNAGTPVCAICVCDDLDFKIDGSVLDTFVFAWWRLPDGLKVPLLVTRKL